MRQIPRYLIIGSIRIAQHTSYYLHLNTLKFSNWYRSNLCVVSGNFTTILWLKLFRELKFLESKIAICNQATETLPCI